MRKYRKDYNQDSQSSTDLYTNKDLDDLANEFVDSLFNCIGCKKVKIDRLKKSLEILESDPIFKHAQIHEIIDINMSEEERYKKKQFYKTKVKFRSWYYFINNYKAGRNN